MNQAEKSAVYSPWTRSIMSMMISLPLCPSCAISPLKAIFGTSSRSRPRLSPTGQEILLYSLNKLVYNISERGGPQPSPLSRRSMFDPVNENAVYLPLTRSIMSMTISPPLCPSCAISPLKAIFGTSSRSRPRLVDSGYKYTSLIS